MKTLFVYSSSKGFVREWGEGLKSIMGGDVDLLEAEKGGAAAPPWENYDRIILGASIHAGSVQPEMASFCEEYQDRLLAKPLGLALAYLQDQEGEANFRTAFPSSLREHALWAGWIGGRIDLAQHNFIMRALIRGITKQKESVYAERWDTLEEAASALEGAGK